MSNRSKHLPFYTFLIGLLTLSIGINILFYNRILILQDFIFGTNPWISVDQYNLIEKEIQRLDNEKYRIVLPNEYTK